MKRPSLTALEARQEREALLRRLADLPLVATRRKPAPRRPAAMAATASAAATSKSPRPVADG